MAEGDGDGADILRVYLAPYLGTGTYSGSVDLYYDTNGDNDPDGTASGNFELGVTNTAVPEPGFVQLPALLGLGALAWWMRRRAR